MKNLNPFNNINFYQNNTNNNMNNNSDINYQPSFIPVTNNKNNEEIFKAHLINMFFY